MKLAAKLGLLVLIMLASIQMMAQRTVTGTVVDESGVPLIGVNVIIEGSTSGMVTDLDGAYSLKVPGEDAVLVFSYIGMLPRYEKVGSRQVIDVQMQEDAQSLDEVIVTGYALQRSRDITGAVETISLEDEPIAPVSTTGQMLQGKLAGVRVNQTSGRPGQGLQFQIRGAFSLTAGSDPLYVVDGMPLSGDISAINPNEIENITVLKDPAAASLYGSRAANGVVLITTKSTKPGQTKIDFNAYYGYEDIPQGRRLDMMNAREYAQFQKEIAESNGRPVDPTFQNPEEYGEGTDWFEEITRRGAIQSYNLTIGTGTEKFNVTTTAGYFNQEGVVVGTSFERLSLRVNTRYQPFERLRIGLNVAPTRTFNTNFNTDGWPYITENLVSSALLTTPLADPYNPDGSLALTASDPATFGNPNWLRVAHDKVYEDKNFQLLSNAFLEWEIVDGLTAKTTASVQTGSRNLFQFNPSTIGVLFIPPPSIPSGSDNNVQFYNWLNENTLNYRKEVGSHNFDLLAGFTSQQFRSEGTLVEGINYPDDKIQSVNAAGQTLVTSNIQEWTLLSYLARFNYNYGGKYLFTASIRRDGSSRFGADNRWGNFPAVSAGWVVSEENFWNIEPISFLKLRGSYGITGNFEIGNFTHLSTLGNVFYPFGGSTVSGRAPNNLGDQQLGWEDNVQFNIGADLHLFNDRIQLSYNYYSRRAQDLLFNVEVPVSSGFSNIQTNIGELKFWGHEFSLFASVASSRDFSWDANFNISFDRNRTESLGTQGGSLPSGILLYQFRSNISNVGEPIAQFFGAIHDGVYVNQADFDSSPKHVSSQVGTVKFRDLNGDGIITFPEDMTVIGSPWPDFVYGMTNNIRFKNLNLSFAIAGSFGNDILAFYENWTANLDGVFNVLSEVQDRWKSEAEPGAGLYGSTQQGTTFLERDRWNSRMIKDGSFLAFKNITLGYNFPVNAEGPFRRAYVFLSSQNPIIITNYPGPNPEVNTQRNGATGANQSSFGNTPGVDENSYPIPRTVTLGVNFGF
ncbi:MAG: TonB-dependent receptor [Lewinellaceae bacterium]|nr:TonB-dependent receptor [Lewinellaceae bacterium]